MQDGLHWATTAEEREEAYRLRYAVYVTETNRYHAVADHAGRRFRDGEEDESGRVLLAVEDGRPVGTMRVHWGAEGPFPKSFRAAYGLDRLARLVPPEKTAVLTRFAILREQRGGLVSISMMLAAYEEALRNGCELACIDCAPHLVTLYRKLGFRPYKEVVHDDETAVLVPLALPVRDFRFLAEVGSPLVAVVPADQPDAPSPAWTAELFPAHAEEEQKARRAWATAFALASEQAKSGQLVFEGMSPEEIERITADGSLVSCTRGMFVVKKGSVGRTLFVVLSGALEVQDNGRGIDTIGAGDCFGEVNFLIRDQRIADVVAATDEVKVLVIAEKQLQRIIADEPRLACRLLLNLSRILSTRLATRAQLQSRLFG